MVVSWWIVAFCAVPSTIHGVCGKLGPLKKSNPLCHISGNRKSFYLGVMLVG